MCASRLLRSIVDNGFQNFSVFVQLAVNAQVRNHRTALVSRKKRESYSNTLVFFCQFIFSPSLPLSLSFSLPQSNRKVSYHRLFCFWRDHVRSLNGMHNNKHISLYMYIYTNPVNTKFCFTKLKKKRSYCEFFFVWWKLKSINVGSWPRRESR